ncbi:MAG: hypothetical protein IJ356_09740 [Erysipelotrichaceae bacterium]|nr:hypothetical protein [Erysipelotrichaceae bacterium]
MIKPEYEMKEYNYKHNYILTIGYVIIGLFVLIVTIYVAYLSYFEDGYSLVDVLIFCFGLLSLAFLIFYEGWLCYIEGTVKYRFEHKGLRAMYQIGKPKFIPWDDFQEVCIAHPPGEKNCPPSIFCIKKDAKRGVFAFWKIDNRTVFRIRYTQEIYERLKEIYPHRIVDYR